MKPQIKFSCSDQPKGYKVNQGNHIIEPINGVIKWHLANMTPDMEKHKVILSFSEAFRELGIHMWPFTFEPTSKIEEAQIKIEFASDSTFTTGVLAYAYYPGSSKEGILRINEDVNWADMHSNDSTHLKTVILHELLHNMGVDHSDTLEALMFPSYTGPKGMHNDDVDAINWLYMHLKLGHIKNVRSALVLKNNIIAKHDRVNKPKKEKAKPTNGAITAKDADQKRASKELLEGVLMFAIFIGIAIGVCYLPHVWLVVLNIIQVALIAIGIGWMRGIQIKF